jgi:metal-dependent amidase/aminoacylase/carboxypeptidase family protein
MIDDGLYTNGDVPLPDVVLGQHLVDIRAGYIATRADYSLPGKSSFEVKIYGRGSHDEERRQNIDPLSTARDIIIDLHNITCRELDTIKTAFISCGNIDARNPPNTNPNEATMRVDIRAYSPNVLEQMVKSFKRIVQEKCDASRYNQTPDFKQMGYTPPLINDPVIEEMITKQFHEFFGQMTEEMHESTASDDFTPSKGFPVLAPNGIPYACWGLGSKYHAWWAALQEQPNVKEMPLAYASNYAPVIQPTLKSDIDALAVAALTFLTRGDRRDEVS